MGTVRAVCISEKKGTEKRPVAQAEFLTDHGIRTDAHAGKWHRQVSLLSYEKVQEFQNLGVRVEDGDFGENLLVEGMDFSGISVGTWISCGDVLLEVTQIGKECHSHCTIYRNVGQCIMPANGVFARVLKGGRIQPGDSIDILGTHLRYRAGVVTVSDKGASGERKDESGPLLRQLLQEGPYVVVEQILIPDEKEQIENTLKDLCDRKHLDLIFTTGGTGLSPRDWTPEATAAVADRMVPGIAEALRAYSMSITPRAMLSRAVAAIRGRTLMINLPGSPRAVQESLDFLLPELKHGLDILTGRAAECGRKTEKREKENPNGTIDQL